MRLPRLPPLLSVFFYIYLNLLLNLPFTPGLSFCYFVFTILSIIFQLPLSLHPASPGPRFPDPSLFVLEAQPWALAPVFHAYILLPHVGLISRTSYVIGRAQRKMKTQGPLIQKRLRFSRWWRKALIKPSAGTFWALGHVWLHESLVLKAGPVCNVSCFNLLFIHRSLNSSSFASVVLTCYFNLLDFAQHIYSNQIRHSVLIIVFCWSGKVARDSILGPAAWKLMLGCSCYSEPKKAVLWG